MEDRRLAARHLAASPIWLELAPDHPLRGALARIEAEPERRRWMAAPAFSRARYKAKPMTRRIGLLRALIILVRDSLRPRDDLAEQLGDIEELILGGHNEAAQRHIYRMLEQDAPAQVIGRLLGLASLNAYDQGKEREAFHTHLLALLCEAPHPAMAEIFGDRFDPAARP